MNKTFLRLGALALAGMMSISSFAQWVEHNDVRYRVIDTEKNYVSVQSPANYSSVSLNVPSSFTLNQGETNEVTYTVTQIDDNAFQASQATDISISGQNLEYIGSKAFASYVKKTIYFSGKFEPKFIGSDAFKSLNLTPNELYLYPLTSNETLNLTWIKEENVAAGAFAGVKLQGVKTIQLGSELKNIPERMFQGTTTETSGQFFCELPVASKLESVGVRAFESSGLVAFGYKNELYWLPGSLKTIGDYAFSNTNLNGYPLRFSKAFNPDSKITSVGEYAFDGASWLDNECFENLFGSFDNDLTYGEGSFHNCGLTSVNLSASSINDVPACAFQGNPITSVTLPENCTSVGNYAFNASVERNIGDLNIPATVQSFGDYAFYNITANNVFIRAEIPFAITDICLPAIASNGNLWIPSVKGVLPAFQNDEDEDGYPTVWAGKTYHQYLPDYTDGNIKYVGIQNEGDLWYKAESYVAATKEVSDSWVTDPDAEVDVTILDNFKYIYNTSYSYNGYSIYDQECKVVKVNENIFTTDGAKAQIKSIEFQTAEITTVPVMQDLTKLEKVVLPESIETLPVYVFLRDAKLTSVNLGDTKVTELPQSSFNQTAIAEIDFSKITKIGTAALKMTPITEAEMPVVESIGVNAFLDCASLETVSFPEVKSVYQTAFSGTNLKEITLPASLSTIGKKAFYTESLEKVNVEYTEVAQIPAMEYASTAFYKPADAPYKAVLHIANDDLSRNDFMTLPITHDAWYFFFSGLNTEVKLNNVKLATDEDYCFVLEDEGANSVSVTNGTTIGVKYNRTFSKADGKNSSNWQAWYVPFQVQTAEQKAGAKFAKLHDTRYDYASKTTYIEYKQVDGEETIKANVPYLVQVEGFEDNNEKKVTFTSDVLATTQSDYLPAPITVSNIMMDFTFTGNYKALDGDKVNEVEDWWAISNGQFMHAQNEVDEEGVVTKKAHLNAFRFYMTQSSRNDDIYGLNQPGPAPSVKVVVLDEDDNITAIMDVAENGELVPVQGMFDLQGRKISAPVKGQVYIENGVKKLAK